MAADLDRAQVYAAELAAFDGTDLEEVVDVAAVVEAMRAVVAGAWWPGGVVTVKAARSDARSSATRCGVEAHAATITIAAPQATLATGAHELAHALAGVADGHGARFRRAHLDLVQVMTNADRVAARGMVHVAQLANAYAAAGLDLADRDWAAPPNVGGAIAL